MCLAFPPAARKCLARAFLACYCGTDTLSRWVALSHFGCHDNNNKAQSGKEWIQQAGGVCLAAGGCKRLRILDNPSRELVLATPLDSDRVRRSFPGAEREDCWLGWSFILRLPESDHDFLVDRRTRLEPLSCTAVGPCSRARATAFISRSFWPLFYFFFIFYCSCKSNPPHRSEEGTTRRKYGVAPASLDNHNDQTEDRSSLIIIPTFSSPVIHLLCLRRLHHAPCFASTA